MEQTRIFESDDIDGIQQAVLSALYSTKDSWIGIRLVNRDGTAIPYGSDEAIARAQQVQQRYHQLFDRLLPGYKVQIDIGNLGGDTGLVVHLPSGSKTTEDDFIPIDGEDESSGEIVIDDDRPDILTFDLDDEDSHSDEEPRETAPAPQQQPAGQPQTDEPQRDPDVCPGQLSFSDLLAQPQQDDTEPETDSSNNEESEEEPSDPQEQETNEADEPMSEHDFLQEAQPNQQEEEFHDLLDHLNENPHIEPAKKADEDADHLVRSGDQPSAEPILEHEALQEDENNDTQEEVPDLLGQQEPAQEDKATDSQPDIPQPRLIDPDELFEGAEQEVPKDPDMEWIWPQDSDKQDVSSSEEKAEDTPQAEIDALAQQEQTDPAQPVEQDINRESDDSDHFDELAQQTEDFLNDENTVQQPAGDISPEINNSSVLQGPTVLEGESIPVDVHTGVDDAEVQELTGQKKPETVEEQKEETDDKAQEPLEEDDESEDNDELDLPEQWNSTPLLQLRDETTGGYTTIKDFAGSSGEQVETAMIYLANHVFQKRLYPHHEPVPNYDPEQIRDELNAAFEQADHQIILTVEKHEITVTFTPLSDEDGAVEVCRTIPLNPRFIRGYGSANDKAARRSSEQLRESVLKELKGHEYSTNTLAKKLGYKSITHSLSAMITELIAQGKIEYTNPYTRSSNQKLRLKESGSKTE